jgi:hypothetical protein
MRMIGIIGNEVEVAVEEEIENERMPGSSRARECDADLSWSGSSRSGPTDHTTLPARIDRPNEQGFS